MRSLLKYKPFKMTRASIKLLLLLFCTACFCTACALYNPSGGVTVVKTCSIPADQTGTLSGRWPITPIPIAFAAGAFNSSETSAITAAADSWNQFFNAASNITTLNYGTSTAPNSSAVPDPSQTGSFCANGILQGSNYNGNVVLYKLSRWPASYPPTAIALTRFCSTTGSPYNRFNMAIIEFNYQDFFISGTKQPDMQSIILHELGHLHGLNHSCEGTTKTGTPNCNDPNLNPDYQTASMYPAFGFDQNGTGEQRRSLGTNDESRANCLYAGTPNTTPSTTR